jgi:hypothetical protein
MIQKPAVVIGARDNQTAARQGIKNPIMHAMSPIWIKVNQGLGLSIQIELFVVVNIAHDYRRGIWAGDFIPPGSTKTQPQIQGLCGIDYFPGEICSPKFFS